MKKSFFCALCFVLCAFSTSFDYTSADVSNATFLADNDIVVKQSVASKYRLGDTILRQEVIGMALKIKGVTLPENYKCKKYFADATQNNWECRAVELAADNGIITRENRNANPGKLVTRAEALAMVMKAGGATTIENSGTRGFNTEGNSNEWQNNLLNGAMTAGIIDTGENFGVNIPAKRSEVFEFAAHLLSISIIPDLDLPVSTCETIQNSDKPYIIDKGEFVYCVNNLEVKTPYTQYLVMRVKGFDAEKAQYKYNYAHHNGVTINLGEYGCCGMGFTGMHILRTMDFQGLKAVPALLDKYEYLVNKNGAVNFVAKNIASFIPINEFFYIADHHAYIAYYYNEGPRSFQNPIPINTLLAEKYVSSSSNFFSVDTNEYSFFHPALFAILNNIDIRSPAYEENTFIMSSSVKELQILRNAIYAKYGRTFTTPELQKFFDSQSWYTKNPNYSDILLSKNDKSIIAYIQDLEKNSK